MTTILYFVSIACNIIDKVPNQIKNNHGNN